MCSPTACVAKIIFGIINTITFLLGLAMFTLGILIQTLPSLSKSALSDVESQLESAASSAGVTLDTSNFDVADVALSFCIALIVIGLFITSTSLLGLVGAKYGLKPVLIVYFVIVLVLFLAQAILVLIVIIDRSVWDNAVKPHLRDTIKNDFAGLEGTDATTLIWNGIMISSGCCGVDNYDDFTGASSWTKTLNSMSYPLVTPIACCQTISSSYTCAISPSDSDNNWNTGCYDKIWDFLLTDTGTVPALAAIILGAQLTILILTIIIIKSMSVIGVV